MEEFVYVQFRNRNDRFLDYFEESQQRALQKKVNIKEYLPKSFSSLVEYMINPNADDFNEEYTQEQREDAEELENNLKMHRSIDPIRGNIGISLIFQARTKDDNQKEIMLEDRLQDHAEDIVLTRKIEDDSGIIEYKFINIIYDVIHSD